jgi:hypothetical protein
MEVEGVIEVVLAGLLTPKLLFNKREAIFGVWVESSRSRTSTLATTRSSQYLSKTFQGNSSFSPFLGLNFNMAATMQVCWSFLDTLGYCRFCLFLGLCIRIQLEPAYISVKRVKRVIF